MVSILSSELMGLLSADQAAPRTKTQIVVNPVNADPAPLPADPRRQANATHVAYQYQLWHTVLAWLRLRPEERLWIEAAEDFDVTAKDTATAVQVSHSARNVTLRDAKVREAIFHCWELRQKDDRATLRFRYLTRGEATVEEGSPFGSAICGLNLWAKAAADDQVAARILSFLRAERVGVPAAFAHFLEYCSPQEAVANLFRPLVFELGSGDASVIQAVVDVELTALAEQVGIMPAAALRARSALFDRVSATASQAKDRWLTRIYLVRVLADATAVVVRPEFEAFMWRTERLEPALKALLNLKASQDTFLETPLPLPVDCLPRATVVASLRERLRPGRIVVV